jgi:hypothetical protein
LLRSVQSLCLIDGEKLQKNLIHFVDSARRDRGAGRERSARSGCIPSGVRRRSRATTAIARDEHEHEEQQCPRPPPVSRSVCGQPTAIHIDFLLPVATGADASAPRTHASKGTSRVREQFPRAFPSRTVRVAYRVAWRPFATARAGYAPARATHPVCLSRARQPGARRYPPQAVAVAPPARTRRARC